VAETEVPALDPPVGREAEGEAAELFFCRRSGDLVLPKPIDWSPWEVPGEQGPPMGDREVRVDSGLKWMVNCQNPCRLTSMEFPTWRASNKEISSQLLFTAMGRYPFSIPLKLSGF